MTNDPNTVTLIDLSAIFWASWHSSANDEVSAATQRTLRGVEKAINGSRYVAVCCDEGRSFRKDIDPEYKANRPEKDATAVNELKVIKERLRADGMLLWGVKGFEADDIIATACDWAQRAGFTVTIATADKDLFQLVNENVSIKSTRTGDLYGPDEIMEKVGVRPGQVADWIALVGDKSDNIKGVKGVGAKRAAELLSEFDSINGIYQDIDKVGVPITPVIRAALKECRPNLDQARKLVALRFDVPIDCEELYQERETKPLNEGTANVETLDGQTPNDVDEAPSLITTPADRPKSEDTLKPTTALVRQPSSFDMQLEPTSLGTAYKLAEGLYNSRLYQRFQNVDAIWAVIIRGREIGLGALTALDAFHVIQGRPAPAAMLIIALAKKDPDCEYLYCTETTATSATWKSKNRKNPTPTSLTYTIEQAQAAGLIKRGTPWETRPDEMLRKTAGSQLARLEYPGATMNLIALEEMADPA